MQEEASTASTVGFAEGFSRKYQYIMDKSSPHVLYRWILFTVVFILYVTRVYFLNGWFIVSYGLGIYMLNQLIGFLSPQVPAVAELVVHYLCFSNSVSPIYCTRFCSV